MLAPQTILKKTKTFPSQQTLATASFLLIVLKPNETNKLI